MDKVVHFEIPYDNKEKAIEFYKKVFQWEIIDMLEMNYTIVRTCETDEGNNHMPKEAGAINGGMFKRTEDLKQAMITINVQSIDESLEKIKENGGEIIKKKAPVGDMGFVAYFKDTEGNIVGLWEDIKKG